MKSVARHWEDGWRQITAGVLIFALVLQGLAFALAANGREIGPSADLASFAGFELCSHNAGAAPPAAPENQPAGAHCVFCLAAVSHALDAAPPALDFHAVVITVVSWLPAVWRLPTTTVDLSARPRGPPSAK
jgi:hypothetical protein